MELMPKYKARQAKRGLLFGDQSVADSLEMPDVSRETMDQTPLKQAMADQTNTDQIQPKADPENLDSTGVTKPSLFQPTTKQKWLGYNEPAKKDALGVDLPTERHDGILKSVLKYAFPALVGMTGGVGALPGLALAFAGDRSRDFAQDKLDTAQYQKNRADKIAQDKAANDALFNREKFDETKAHNRAMESIGYGNLKKGGAGNKEETGLRKEFMQSPTYKSYQTSTTGLQKMENSMSGADRSGFDDMALIFNYMKTLDPDSVVREGEYRTAENNASLLQKMGISLEKLASGQRLTEDQRQLIIKSARMQNKAHQERFDELANEYAGLASSYGATPENVTIGYKPGGRTSSVGNTNIGSTYSPEEIAAEKQRRAAMRGLK